MRARRLLWLIPTLCLVTLFTALGTWQLERGKLKARMLEDFQASVDAAPRPMDRFLQAPALPLRAAMAQTGTGEVSPHDGPTLPARVSGRGRFDATATVFLDNQVQDGQPGIHVLVLFHPQSAPRPLLVNLGWQPLPDRSNIALPAIPQGEITVRGLLVPPTAVGIRLGNAEWTRDEPPPLLAFLDIAALREQMGNEMFEGQMLLDDDLDFGLVRRWQALPNTIPPERHRGYAVQWFALALTVLVVFLVLSRRRPREKDESTR